MNLIYFLKEYYPVYFDWLAAITVLVKFRKNWPLPLRVFGIFIIVYAVLDTSGSILAAFYKIKNHFYYNIVYDIEFLITAFFLYHQLHNRIIKKLILAFLFIFPLFALLNTVAIQGFFTWQTYSFVFGGSFILLLSVAYLWQLYISEETQSIFHDPVFWFSLSWILNFGITVPYFGMLNYLLENYSSLASLYYKVIDISECIRNILITTGFLCLRVEKK